ncbi:MAG: hypothetical protein RIM33_05990 [Alphaproteobacteria bacterium]
MTKSTGQDTRGIFDLKPGDYSEEEPVVPLIYGVEWYRRFQEFLESVPQLSSLFQLFGGKATHSCSAGDMVRLHTRAIGYLHRSMNPQLRDSVTKVIAAFVKQNSTAWCEPDATLPSADPSILAQLNEFGHAPLPPLADAHVTTIRDRIEKVGFVPADAIFSTSRDVMAKGADDLRGGHNLAHVRATDVLRLPGLVDQATSPDLLSLVAAHLGAPPILIDVSAWRSFAGDTGAKEARDAQLFHFDLDSYRFCKVFLYLTDVDDGSGPHMFVPTTHRPDVIAGKAPSEGTAGFAAFEKWYFGTLRKTEDELAAHIGINPISIGGRAGTRFVANTEAIHRGIPPVDRDRTVLQFVYGIAPSTAWTAPFDAVLPYDLDGKPIRRLKGPAAYTLRLMFPNLV